ncbi:MAG: hypothetical protein SF123_02460 [Chloroflexota bacterium]|nr:hypothetical protein [Chloroflexota bacterium]
MGRFDIRPFRDAYPRTHLTYAKDRTTAQLPVEIHSTIVASFDHHLSRLNELLATLRCSEFSEVDQPTKSVTPVSAENSVVTVDRLLDSPVLAAPEQPTFDQAFKRFEPMFHTVFYRRYHPTIRDDMKQVAFISLFKKWRKDPTFLDNTASYVVTAAIFGVGNWRKKQMKTTRRETRMHVDGHDKVIGATRAQRDHDAWAQSIDRRIDVELARSAVLFQYPKAEEREWASNIVRRLKLGHNRISTIMRSRVKKRRFFVVKAHVLETLRTQLAEYAPVKMSGVVFEAENP